MMRASKTRIVCLVAMLVAGIVAAMGRGYVEQEMAVAHGSRTIRGVMASPANASGKTPLVIVAHGFNGTLDFGRAYFDTLCSMGYRCFAFDFPCGSLHSRSGGSTIDMSVRDQAADLVALVRHFQAQPYVDSSSIVLEGESQGGLAAALAAAKLGSEVSRLVLVYPALCIPADWTSRYKQPTDIPDTTLVWNVPVGRRYFEEVRTIDVFATIGSYGRPVLLVHGDKDPVVPIDYSRRAATTYAHAQLAVIAGAGHGFRDDALRESIDHIARFLKR